PDGGGDPARGRMARRRRRRGAQALRDGRAPDRDGRGRRRHRRPRPQRPGPAHGRRAPEGRTHPPLDQPVRSQAVDAVPVGADGVAAGAEEEARLPAARADLPGSAVIVAIGVDVCDVARIRRALEGPTGARFRARVFTAAEQAYCEARGRARFASYAARFAAKEAAMKALGTGWSAGVSWQDFEVVRADGEPP